MSKTQLINLRNKFIKLKVYMSRTTTYIALINSGMILFLVLDRLGIEVKNFLFIFVIGVFGLIFLGWIEIELLKGRQQEFIEMFDYNPRLTRMNKRINEICELLNKRK